MSRYFKVPVIGGVLDIDYYHLEQGISISETEALVKLREGFKVRESWQEIMEEEWILAQPPESGLAEPTETTEQKLTRLDSQNIILMDALATVFEEVLALREIVEGGTEE
jgi:hypothetical protein